MSTPLIDQAARDRALDVSQSFIVQAPAGSGKTGLLTLRFLRLLSISEQPEQVLAITFTRKAASEMRERILQTLFWAEGTEQNAESPSDPYDQQRLQLATEVLKRDQQLDWQLLENSSRLRIQTIDSFCHYLARQLPVLSRIGGNPRISEDVELCFRDAIHNTLKQLDTNRDISSDIELIQIHLDNDISRLERLLKNLLARWEQWLPYILQIGNSSNAAREYLQTCLAELIEESVAEVTLGLEDHSQTIIELVNFALSNLQQQAPPLYENCSELSSLPSYDLNGMESWALIANLLIVDTGSWRKRVDVRIGFPPGDKADKEHQALCKSRKQQFAELREQLAENDDLLESLNYLRLLPRSSTDDQQWEFLSSLTRVLALLSSELLLSFRRFRVIDYTETGAAARAALGTDINPTDLALALDHNIQHILVDEFQDTSQLQLDILQQLTNGWEQDDQHSLFLVGDAMQSCYGFRNANVGIYLNVQRNGLPQVAVEALRLQANFRSDAGIVDWVNRHFSTAFPNTANSSRGAVPYASSTAVKSALAKNPVATEIITYTEGQRISARAAEAKRIVEHISHLKAASKTDSIAILVRSRGHLDYIIQALRENKIPWQSTDIDRMGAMQIIEDLLSLTRALLHPFDRLSWFAILRAPWLGLQVSDLHAIAQHSQQQSVWSSIQNYSDIQNLSGDAKPRLAQFAQCLSYAMHYRFRMPLRELVESSWNLLRGAATIESEREIACASHFFDLLSEQELAGGLANMQTFQEAVIKSFIPTLSQNSICTGESSVQLLTMHKAKGLEFDHVIVPGLANRPGSDDKPLFSWHERLNNKGEAQLFVAALSATGSEEDSLYTLLRHEKQQKGLLENTRLLYIAITRAKKSARLFATAALNKNQEVQISSQCLLSRLWHEIQREASDLQIISLDSLASDSTSTAPAGDSELPIPTPIRRFEKMPELTQAEHGALNQLLLESNDEIPSQEDNEEEQAATEQRLSAQVGRLIHSALEDYANSSDKASWINKLAKHRNYWQLQLRSCSSLQGCQQALDYIEASVRQTVLNEELSWIFDECQPECQSEFSITSIQYGKMRSHILDRTLIDKNNVRWIIDYKTGSPENETEENFIALQQSIYTPQLQRYKALMQQLEPRETRAALLFTAIPKLVVIKDL